MDNSIGLARLINEILLSLSGTVAGDITSIDTENDFL
jgi:hypothetical protein